MHADRDVHKQLAATGVARTAELVKAFAAWTIMDCHDLRAAVVAPGSALPPPAARDCMIANRYRWHLRRIPRSERELVVI